VVLPQQTPAPAMALMQLLEVNTKVDEVPEEIQQLELNPVEVVVVVTSAAVAVDAK
jgi:hypothetical protein